MYVKIYHKTNNNFLLVKNIEPTSTEEKNHLKYAKKGKIIYNEIAIIFLCKSASLVSNRSSHIQPAGNSFEVSAKTNKTIQLDIKMNSI